MGTDSETPHLLGRRQWGPKPFDYHPGMEAIFNALWKELLHQEKVYVTWTKQRVNEILSSRTLPTPQKDVSKPGLFYLHQFDGEVKLPYFWDHPSGEVFCREWRILSAFRNSKND